MWIPFERPQLPPAFERNSAIRLVLRHCPLSEHPGTNLQKQTKGFKLTDTSFITKSSCYSGHCICFSVPALYCTNKNSGSQAAPHKHHQGGFVLFIQCTPHKNFPWSHSKMGAGPLSRGQGLYRIAGIQTRTGSGVHSDATNCTTPAL